MATVVEKAGQRATYDHERQQWVSDPPIFGEILNVFLASRDPGRYDPNPAATAAFRAVQTVGVTIVSVDPPEKNPPGTVD